MNTNDALVTLARAMIDIESISGNEAGMARFLERYLFERGWQVTLQEIAPERYNVWAHRGNRPKLVFNSHIDTVPPFFPSRIDGPYLRGRGACDTKSLIAAQLFAAQILVEKGCEDLGLLYVVGEEVDHSGMIAANKLGLNPDFLIVAEPTQSKLVSRQKGILKIRLDSKGKAAHSGYPHTGRSAIDPLIDVLSDLRKTEWPGDTVLGETTMNIGLLGGGCAANVVPERAFAEVMFRVVTSQEDIYEKVRAIAADRVAITVISANNPTDLTTLPGYDTTIIAFNTDIPYLHFDGKALLWGAGSIMDAHTADEKILLEDLPRAVTTYVALAQTCLGIT